ncbi:MAG TPA: hypothetical protein VIE42_11845 [Steroidobacteraceae bacterium]
MSSNDIHLLARAAGIDEPPADSRGPFEVLDDLMQVIEALCPTYPERDTFADSSAFKL